MWFHALLSRLRRAYRRRLPPLRRLRDPALARMGLRVSMGPGLGARPHEVVVSFHVDARSLVAGLDRLSAAVEEVAAAWDALPPGARDHLGTLTLTMGDTPPDPSVGTSGEPKA